MTAITHDTPQHEHVVPAGPEKRVCKRAMLIPKTGHVADHITTLMDFSEVICPAERRALREIIETGEVVRENGRVYLVARVSADTLDSLATFETSREDMEDNGDDEPEETDCDLGYGETPGLEGCELDEADMEFDAPEHRRRFIAERQKPGRGHIYQGGRLIYRPSYDATRDQEELRKAQRQVGATVYRNRLRD